MANDILQNLEPETTHETKPSEKKRRKKILGIKARGNCWQIDTFYKGIRLRERCATPEMAESVLRKMKSLIDEGRYLEKKREAKETLGEIRDRYVDYCRGIKQKTVDDKEDHLKYILDFFGIDTPIGKVTKADVERFHAHLGSVIAQRKQTTLSVATINRRMACLKHFLHKAEEWGVIAENPARGTKLHKENNRRLRFLSAEECEALLTACPTQPPLRQVVTLALHTGMRRNEILTLRWRDVNLRERFIELLDQKNGERGIVPLNQIAVEVLRSVPRRLDSDFVFTGRFPGQPFFDLKGRFEQAVKAAKLEGVTFHTLRHSAASHLVMSGVDLATVREILRHKSISMTLRYSHLAPEHKKAAVDALAKALAGEAGKAESGTKTA